ncbi:hypothetical protein BAU08_13790 [Bordetella bronchialis]|uniref:Uncharacterized protein n=2 Tax=Bordetella bronchialis TaxID=463025 RepID=A0A193FYK8_9BORD|nr:hypothetical protein BAU08_13790 [Bordetella bronchialis]
MHREDTAMNAEQYDIARLASLAIHFVLGSGASIEDAIRVLELAERMLRDAYDEERGQAADPGAQITALH